MTALTTHHPNTGGVSGAVEEPQAENRHDKDSQKLTKPLTEEQLRLVAVKTEGAMNLIRLCGSVEKARHWLEVAHQAILATQ